MKKLLFCLFFSLLVLAGCAGHPAEPATAASGEATTAPTAPATEETTIPLEESLPEESTPSAEPSQPTEPEHEPVYVETEFAYGPEVVVDGFPTRSYAREELVYLRADDLSDLLEDFSWQPLDDGQTLSLHYGAEALTLPLVPYEQPGGSMDALIFPEPYAVLLPLPALQELSGIQVLEDGEESKIYISRSVDPGQIPTGVRVPILMYHCISDDIFGIKSLFTAPEAFREQMEYLIDQGYEPILFSDLSHLGDYTKPILITLDDGYENNYTEMYPIIRKYGIPVTIFMISNFFGRERYLTADEAWEMASSGLVSIQSHTADHIRLSLADGEAQESSMVRAQLAIARVTGRVPYVLSYPEGRFTDETQQLAAKYYALAVKTGNAPWTTDGNWQQICRLSMYRDTSLAEFAAMLEGTAVSSPKS